MKKFLLNEYLKLSDNKLVYPIRLLLRIVGCIVICQLTYVGLHSFASTDQTNIVLYREFIFNTAFILWVIALIIISWLGRIEKNKIRE